MIDAQDLVAYPIFIGVTVLIGGAFIASDWSQRPSSPYHTSQKTPCDNSWRHALLRFYGMGHLPQWFGLTVAAVISLIWVCLFGAILKGLFTVFLDLIEFHPGQSLNTEQTSLARLSLLAFTALTPALGGIVAFPFTVLRTRYNARQTDAAEQGLITDRVNKAVEGLGAEKTVKRKVERWSIGRRITEIEEVTEPNIEVRIGAIYSLERISQDSDRDHITIMKILCAYIRENAPATAAKPFPLPDWPALPEGVTLEQPTTRDIADARAKDIRDWAKQLRTSHPPRIDIQTALDVIGRRGQDRIDLERDAEHWDGQRYKLDLRDTNLQAANLSKLNFARAKLNRTQMQGSYLSYAQLESADFDQAQLQGAHLEEAKLQRAKLWNVDLEGAVLRGAKLQSATLSWARMQGANLAYAEMQDSDLTKASMQETYLLGSRLQGACLDRAQLQNCCLSASQLQGASLSRAQLQAAEFEKSQLNDKTSLKEADLRGSRWRVCDLSSLDTDIDLFRHTYADGSVQPPIAWGDARPAGWETEQVLGIFEFDWRLGEFRGDLGDDPAAPN